LKNTIFLWVYLAKPLDFSIPAAFLISVPTFTVAFFTASHAFVRSLSVHDPEEHEPDPHDIPVAKVSQ
jgi:hypothetical protein